MSVFFYWLAVTVGGVGLLVLAIFLALHLRVLIFLIQHVERIFVEMPPFRVPPGQPVPGAEEVLIAGDCGISIHGCYLKGKGQRRGVILFGIEFGSNCWSCQHYVTDLVDAGYDIFAIEMRGQGKSSPQSGYEPLQWVTEFEVSDYRAAVNYLKSRDDRPAEGIGFFGLSKGASAGLVVAAEDPWVRCCVTDGAFGTVTTMVPYMAHWVTLYVSTPILTGRVPDWYFAHVARVAMARVERKRKVRYVHLERYIRKLAGRPFFMIHGGGDRYIKPAMAERLFAIARQPKELWMVPKAKHNQAIQVEAEAYRQKVLAFFDRHLAARSASQKADSEGLRNVERFPDNFFEPGANGDAKTPFDKNADSKVGDDGMPATEFGRTD